MTALTVFAVGNLAIGTAGWATTDGTHRHFHAMNAMWNTINLGIGIVGMINAFREDPSAPDDAARERIRGHQRVYLVNAGLDVAYIAAGALTWALGEAPRARGYGAAILFQGLALLGFDLAMVATHQRAVARVAVQAGSGGIRLKIDAQF